MKQTSGEKLDLKKKKKKPGTGKKLKIAGAVGVFLACYLGSAVVPYLEHKPVSEEKKKELQELEFYSDEQGTERVAYIDDNEEALLLRFQMIEAAEKEILLSTFDFNADESGKDVLCALLHAAQRGVQVKIMVDGLSGFLDVASSPLFQAVAAQENVELKIYNPVELYRPWRFQARLHDKYLVIDRKMYLLGGRNTTDLFLGDYSSSKNIDRELLVYETEEKKDASIDALIEYFNGIWGMECVKPLKISKDTEELRAACEELEERYEKLPQLYPQARVQPDWEKETMAADKVTLLSNPTQAGNKEPWLWYGLNELMEQSREVTIYTPYIICGKEMYQDLHELCEKTDHVEIITNDVSSGANPWGCTDYLNQKERIHETGVTVYEYLGGHSSHTKAVLADDTMSVVGSYNMDMRSTYLDTELMLAVDSRELNEVIRKEAERDKTYSRFMNEDGEYVYGENYEAREMPWSKKLSYLFFRVITVPIRKFL